TKAPSRDAIRVARGSRGTGKAGGGERTGTGLFLDLSIGRPLWRFCKNAGVKRRRRLATGDYDGKKRAAAPEALEPRPRAALPAFARGAARWRRMTGVNGCNAADVMQRM
ncbi:hypothetical protein PPH41_28695, partial [Burkholderia gladioli]|nr:hypothetical protein [Burkholderia gladioli]